MLLSIEDLNQLSWSLGVCTITIFFLMMPSRTGDFLSILHCRENGLDFALDTSESIGVFSGSIQFRGRMLHSSSRFFVILKTATGQSWISTFDRIAEKWAGATSFLEIVGVLTKPICMQGEFQDDFAPV